MKKTEMIKLVDERVTDLKSVIATLKVSDCNKNTRSTQLYKLGRQRRVMNLIKSLLNQLGDEVKLTDAEKDTFVLITTLTTERTARTSVECHVGDDIVETLQKYDGVKNISDKLNKYCEKNGLCLNYKTGKIDFAKPTTTKEDK